MWQSVRLPDSAFEVRLEKRPNRQNRSALANDARRDNQKGCRWSQKNKIYAVGDNRFGQCGQNNILYPEVKKLTEVLFEW